MTIIGKKRYNIGINCIEIRPFCLSIVKIKWYNIEEFN